MKVVRAMKKVSRLQGQIKELKKRISSSLNTIADNETFDEDYKELENILNNKIRQLITLKTQIMITNVKFDMFNVVLNLGELKSYIDYLRELKPKHGLIKDDYSNEMTKFKSQITVAERNKAIDECQTFINRLTDELDEFNAKTDLEKKDVVVLTAI